MRRRRRPALFTCCLGLFLTTLDTTVALVAVPAIGRDLHAGGQALQWVISSSIVVRGCLMLSAGALGDRLGHRRVFQHGMLLFGAGSLLCSVAPSAGLLIAARVLQAVGGSVLIPNSLALLTTLYPAGPKRSHAIGVWGATVGVSTGLGPLVGGALVDLLGWRSVFWINLPVVALAVVLARRCFPASRPAGRRPLDLPGQVLGCGVLGCTTSGFISASGAGWGSTTPLILFGLAVLALAAFITVELRSPAPLMDVRDFRRPTFTGAIVVTVLAMVVLFGFLFLNVLYLQDARGYSAFSAGLLVMPAMLCTLVLAPISGRLVAARGERLPATLAGALMLGGTLILARVSADAPVALLLVAYVLIGSGLGLVNTPVITAIIAGMPPERAGVAGALTSTFRQVGGSIGVALLGTVAFTGFAADLPARAAALGVTGAARRQLAAMAENPGSLSSPLQITPDAQRAVAEAFTTGMHHAYALAAACALAFTIAAVFSFPHVGAGAGRPAADEAAVPS
ncbi:MAG: transporter [Conexibacter sp.]|nr:transporter [Conexibacter sp.]